MCFGGLEVNGKRSGDFLQQNMKTLPFRLLHTESRHLLTSVVFQTVYFNFLRKGKEDKNMYNTVE